MVAELVLFVELPFEVELFGVRVVVMGMVTVNGTVSRFGPRETPVEIEVKTVTWAAVALEVVVEFCQGFVRLDRKKGLAELTWARTLVVRANGTRRRE